MTQLQSSQEQLQGVFNVSYLITNHLPGGVSLHVDLHVAGKQVTGFGRVFQATAKPVNVLSKLSGEWSYMCTMASCNILVVLDGISLNGVENTKIRMSLADNWQSGSASFQYLDNGEWHDCDIAKVELSESLPISKLAEVTKEYAKKTLV
ncbi:MULTISPECIES: DUF1842 domain-containing protein [unclassified Shewanella]|uniref:DUF1842 domain-containing protein n=1 Tax=unclassified Shewanella TaxID=196818 RepID=UPI000C7D51F5|nr:MULTISPECIES: DUF1842 domain-containing protein [unclassified Shewanella]PKG59051.1 hypothetical protein CXF82_01315 [Shewanella sp. GutDb-MelDb]PKG76627.1 hypothetical protein CXF86_00675 [Shewanella sp. GutCb]